MSKKLKRQTIGKCGHIYEFEKLPDKSIEMYLGSKGIGNFKSKSKAIKYAKSFERHIC